MSIPKQVSLTIPGPTGRPILGHLTDFKSRPIDLFVSNTGKYGDVVQFKILTRRIILLNHPDAVKHVLLDNHKNYNKQTIVVKKLMILGNGLIFSDGDEWKRQRKMLQPSFRKKCLRQFFDIMKNETHHTLQNWQANRRENIDLSEEISQLTLRIVCRALFGSKIDSAEGLGASVAYLLHAARSRTLNLVNLPLSVPTSNNLKFRKHRRILSDHIEALIRKRKIDGPGEDMLSMLLYHEEQISEQELLSQVQTFLLAGHDTTASTVLWTLYLLSQNQKYLGQCQEELAGVDIEDMNSIKTLPHIQHVLQESLRLYPPAWIIPRLSIGEDSYKGYPIPEQCPVYLSPYTLHRHQDYWDKPEQFRPERFEQEIREPYSYIPFGAGPRICIGREFAMQEAMVILGLLLKQYDIKVFGNKYLPKAGITLRPHQNVMAKISPIVAANMMRTKTA